LIYQQGLYCGMFINRHITKCFTKNIKTAGVISMKCFSDHPLCLNRVTTSGRKGDDFRAKSLGYYLSLPCLASFFVTTPGHSQEQQAITKADNALEVISVTARKRSESVLDVPLSIQAFSAQDLAESGINELESLATVAPNLDFQNVGNSQAGRFNSAIRFRGMDTATTTPTNQTGAFFVDGINILGGASSVSFTDVASVEVIKGPQPVYFGRGTFGGAINYVTVSPSYEFGGALSTAYSPTFGSQDLTAYIEGGLSGDLAGRLSLFSRTQGATFTANDGGDLGEESTYGLSVILEYRPSDALRVKSRLAYSEDDDGPASTTYVPFGYGLGNIDIGTPITVNTTNGEVTTSFAQTYFQGNVPQVDISSNTSFYSVREGTDSEINVGDAFSSIPYDTDTPSLDHFGLRGDMLTASVAADYDYSDAVTLSGLFGYNDKATTQIRDGDLYDNEAWAVYAALRLTSWSAEFRMAYDNDKPYRFLAGINYAKARQFGDVDGGYSIWDGLFGTLQIDEGSSSLEVSDITTLGVFASLEYDFSDWVTLAAEARYQQDESANQTGWYGALVPSATLEFSELLPRISLTMTPFERTNVYVSYAEGTLPGMVNTTFDSLSDALKLEAQEQFPYIQDELGSEILKTYELGWKQSTLNGALWFSVVGFYQDWQGMKGTSTFAFTSPSTGTTSLLSATLEGSSTQKGIEFESRWSITDKFQINAVYGYTDSTYDEYAASSLNYVLGLTTGNNYLANGNTLPRSPKHSGALSGIWEDTLNNDWVFQARADVAYRGESYTDELNLTTISAYSLLNFRFGIENDEGLGLALYCTNCLDKSGWATGRRLTDFGVLPYNFFSNQGAVVDPISPREIGVKFNYEF
jgi:iron complex outermembrane receptor protein